MSFSQTPERYEALDVLRGLAALCVVFWHWQWFYCAAPLKCSADCQIAPNSDPLFASKNDPSDGAETGGAEPHIAEQSPVLAGREW
jgi:hypothetical protein